MNSSPALCLALIAILAATGCSSAKHTQQNVSALGPLAEGLARVTLKRKHQRIGGSATSHVSDQGAVVEFGSEVADQQDVFIVRRVENKRLRDPLFTPTIMATPEQLAGELVANLLLGPEFETKIIDEQKLIDGVHIGALGRGGTLVWDRKPGNMYLTIRNQPLDSKKSLEKLIFHRIGPYKILPGANNIFELSFGLNMFSSKNGGFTAKLKKLNN